MTTIKHDNRPGKGWKHFYGPVYEHKSGVRIHALGYVRLPNGDFISATKYPESLAASRIIRINGGNKKRGLMAWAMTII